MTSGGVGGNGHGEASRDHLREGENGHGEASRDHLGGGGKWSRT